MMNNNTIKNIKPILADQIETTRVKKIENDQDLKNVAQEFESLFINEMLKRANSAKLSKTILTSDAEETYTSLLNQERSKLIAKNHNFGIAEALVKQFSLKPRSSGLISYNKEG